VQEVRPPLGSQLTSGRRVDHDVSHSPRVDAGRLLGRPQYQPHGNGQADCPGGLFVAEKLSNENSAAMAADDYAIVVGITKYPGLGVSPDDPADLKGSERDALEVANWLKAKDGGDLPDDPHHVNLICTSDFQSEPTATQGEPQQQRLRDAFHALVEAGKGK